MPESLESEVSETPILDQLEKFRSRLLTAVGALFVGVVVGFVLVHFFGWIRILVRPIEPFLEDGRLSAFSPLTPFLLELKLAALVGFILAFPVFVHQVWAHLSPMLDREQKRIVLPSMFAAVFLFMLGVLTAYLILPLSLRWLFAFQEDYLDLVIEANQYLTFVVRILLAFGLVFELPVVVMILTTLGIVTPDFLRDKRRHSIVAITVMASLITPGDLPSTFLMMFPMIVLYELSILLSTGIEKRRRLESA